jgi:hypothetical protein
VGGIRLGLREEDVVDWERFIASLKEIHARIE